MNYLAHFYLSFDDSEILTGNFLGDFVTKKEYATLPLKIQQGIDLHREIDFLMDNHEVSKASKRVFANHRHYSNVIIDVVYDHFLAKNWERYSDLPLLDAATGYYTTIDQHHNWLNYKAGQYFHYMKLRNWIQMYPTIDGIDQILKSMSRRTPYENTMYSAAIELEKHYQELEEGFTEFFEIVKLMAEGFLGECGVK